MMKDLNKAGYFGFFLKPFDFCFYRNKKNVFKPDDVKHIPLPCVGDDLLEKSLRYPRLAGEDWQQLPSPIQQRFTKYKKQGAVTIYRGHVHELRYHFVGRLLYWLGKFIGNPLPDPACSDEPCLVLVCEGENAKTQYWTRLYGRGAKSPQKIHSVKSFSGPTGLEEMITNFLGMTLNLIPKKDRLQFISDRYFLTLFGRRLFIPKFLPPFTMTVKHKMIDDDWFEFTINLTSPLIGELLYQSCFFKEVKDHD